MHVLLKRSIVTLHVYFLDNYLHWMQPHVHTINVLHNTYIYNAPTSMNNSNITIDYGRTISCCRNNNAVINIHINQLAGNMKTTACAMLKIGIVM